jgi:hypothetical protein
MPTLTYQTNVALMRWLRGIATPPPAGLFVAALTQAPNIDGTGVSEVTGGSYSRRPLTLAPETQSAGIVSTSNLNAIVFPTATQDWPTVTHLGVLSDVGDLLFFGPLAAPRGVKAADTLAFGEGSIQLRLR